MQLFIDRETELSTELWATQVQLYILRFLTPEQLREEIRERIWHVRDGDTAWWLYYSAVMRGASKQRNGLYPIAGKRRRLKTLLRCDHCRKIAEYADYERDWLLCYEHAQPYIVDVAEEYDLTD